MKAVILAGGFGTRISEESVFRPKPMIEIGGKPLLWHIMKIYSHHGINEFVICLGYMHHVIKDYFVNYSLRNSDLMIDLSTGLCEVKTQSAENWKIHLVDTGIDTLTGGRLKRVAHLLGDDDFCFTYGDGVSNLDIKRLVDFHRGHGLLATLTGVQPAGKFGALGIEDERVKAFKEKPLGDGSWVNGGFFVLSPKVIDLIEGDLTAWEEQPLEALAHGGDLAVWKHHGFWQCMDTLRDKQKLEELWDSSPPWRVWS
jgi:glucose-1-phosphate cytidylyltransferase